MTGAGTGCGVVGAHRLGLVLAAACLFAMPVAAAQAGARSTTALHVEAARQPQRVHGSDRREHVEYDLVITNAFGAAATLRSLEVRGDGRRLLTLRGPALMAATRPLLSPNSTVTLAPSSTVMTQVDLVLPRAYGRTAPKRLTHRITYSIPADAPLRSVIGSTIVAAPNLRVDPRSPVVIASPLRGSGWANGNGCCADPTSPHRSTLLNFNGAYIAFEQFAIDWSQAVGGRVYRGDGKRNSDWPSFGQPLYAVADGIVVAAVDGKPDIPPFEQNPNLRTPEDYSGNNVILRIGRDRYATYAHMVRGSVRVRRGQRVRAGQQLGRLGNSGNSTGPHLHFGIQEGPSFFSQSVPFEFNRYTLEGMAGPNSTAQRIDLIGPRRRERRSFPLMRSVITVSPATPSGSGLTGRR